MASFNVTIDDDRNSTMFVYQPETCNGSGWTVNQRGYLGTYRNCTTDAGPSANVTFTGVAVYYRSAYIEGTSMRFRLDGILSDDIDLSTPPGQAVNRTATNIFWQKTALDNTGHVLELLPGSKSSTLTVDALIVTQIQASNSTFHIPPISIPSIILGLAGAALPTESASTNKFAIGFGVTFGSLSLIILIAMFIFLGRRRRELNKNIGWSKPVPSPRPPSSVSSHGEPTPDNYTPPVNSPKMGEVVRMRPLPSRSNDHGSFSTFDFEQHDGWSSPAPSSMNLLSPMHPSASTRQDHLPSLSRNTTFTSTSRLEPLRKGMTS